MTVATALLTRPTDGPGRASRGRARRVRSRSALAGPAVGTLAWRHGAAKNGARAKGPRRRTRGRPRALGFHPRSSVTQTSGSPVTSR